MKGTLFQCDPIPNVKFLWLFVLFSTTFLLFNLNSQECSLKSLHRILYTEKIQQNVDLTYWRFNYTEPNDLDDILSLNRPNFLKNFKNPCWNEAVQDRKTKKIEFELKCLPYFYLIGAEKSGTTDLFLRLLKHPEIVEPNGYFHKETMWWAWTRFGYSVYDYGSTPKHFLEYLTAFKTASKKIQLRNISLNNGEIYHQCVTGDGSPITFWDFTGWKKIPQNHGLINPKYLTPHCIHHLTPNAKLILILRNPVDRLYSDFLFVRKSHKNFNSSQRLRTRENFHFQVVEAVKNLKKCIRKYSLKFCLFNKLFNLDSFLRFESGFYCVYLKEWFKVFDRNQFYILRSEDFKKNISGHLKKIFEFLNLTSLSDSEVEKFSSGNLLNTRRKDVLMVGPMFRKTRRLLTELYEPFNKELAVMLNDERFHWKT